MRINHTNVMDEYDEDEYGGRLLEMLEIGRDERGVQ